MLLTRPQARQDPRSPVDADCQLCWGVYVAGHDNPQVVQHFLVCADGRRRSIGRSALRQPGFAHHLESWAGYPNSHYVSLRSSTPPFAAMSAAANTLLLNTSHVERTQEAFTTRSSQGRPHLAAMMASCTGCSLPLCRAAPGQRERALPHPMLPVYSPLSPQSPPSRRPSYGSPRMVTSPSQTISTRRVLAVPTTPAPFSSTSILRSGRRTPGTKPTDPTLS